MSDPIHFRVSHTIRRLAAAVSKHALWLTLILIVALVSIIVIMARQPYVRDYTSGVSREEGMKRLQLAYELALEEKYLEAVLHLEVANQAVEESKGYTTWRVARGSGGYDIPNPHLTVPLLLGECLTKCERLAESRTYFDQVAKRWPAEDKSVVIYQIDWGNSPYTKCVLRLRKKELLKRLRALDSTTHLYLYHPPETGSDMSMDAWPGFFPN
jgi:hypothetical protein